jgi:hypothetical protein
MLQVRCQVVPDRWDAAMAELAEFRLRQAPDALEVAASANELKR